MTELRLGDEVDDHCIKCRRLTNHSVVSLLEGEIAKVRCRSCYHEHSYLHEQAPPSKKDLKKMELENEAAAAAKVNGQTESEPEAEPEPEPEAEPVEVVVEVVEEETAEAKPVKKVRAKAKKS